MGRKGSRTQARSVAISCVRWTPAILVLFAPASARAQRPTDVPGLGDPHTSLGHDEAPPAPAHKTDDDQPDFSKERTAQAGARHPHTHLNDDGALELGFRLGYAVPMGSAFSGSSSDVGQGDLFSSRVPFWFDLGYRIPNVYVGLFLQVGIVNIAQNTTTGCGQGNGISCSGSDITFGGGLAAHAAPGAIFDPWLGLGFGYEWLTFSESAPGASASLSFDGPQFFTFQIGGDFKTVDNLRFGPFVSISTGQYQKASLSGTSGDIRDQTFHQWITFGLRGVYDLRLGPQHTGVD